MGIQLIGAAFDNWAAATPPVPFRALLYMSYRALDIASAASPRALYFGGWPAIAKSMGLSAPDGDAAKQVVKRAIACLVRLRAIECIQQGWVGSNAVYRLLVETPPETSKSM